MVAPLIPASLHGLRVLVADTSGSNREILQRYLETWGMRVDGVSSGVNALAALRSAAARRQSYAIAIVEQRLSDMDGFALARAIRDEPALAPVRMVLTTAWDEPGGAAQALTAGYMAYLTKPLKQALLLAAYRRA